METAFVHHRTDLAQQYCDALLGRSPFGFRAGLFLAAPRRTGKSTFLRRDLVPALQNNGVQTIYVDLWSDRTADPADLISDALTDHLLGLQSKAERAVKRSGLRQISLAGIRLSLGDTHSSVAQTLTHQLVSIANKRNSSVALIVDEAQHALSGETGLAAMFALKAARDAMNQTDPEGVPRLALVMTGSHRDKLAALVTNRDQPFYGASVIDMPLLGTGYVKGYVKWVNARLAEGNRFDFDEVNAAFSLLGNRPELLEQVLREAAFGQGANSLGKTVSSRAHELRERLWAAYDSDFGTLSPLQRAIIERLISDGEKLSPFAKPTLTALSSDLGRTIKTSEVQKALNALRDKGLVWQSGRGAYAIEDQGMIGWLRARGSEAQKT